MKKLLLPFLALLFFISCEKEPSIDPVSEENIAENIAEDGSSNARRSGKIDVCHNGHIININVNAIPAHQAHGDAVDMDGDGFYDMENECGEPVDCDDTDDQLTDNCCPGVEIDSDGPLYVALADEDGLYNWQEAKNQCVAKALEDGCGWYLPTIDELNDLYLNRNIIGGFDQSGSSRGSFYWSSTPLAGAFSWGHQFFDGGGQGIDFRGSFFSCRCVRR